MQKFRRLLYPALTLCFLLGLLGFFLGRRSVDGTLLSTQHPTPSEAQSRSLPVEASDAARQTTERVELNRATLEELMTLPGIGETRAEEIIRYRNAHGEFKSIDDIKNITGIKEGIFERIRSLITV